MRECGGRGSISASRRQILFPIVFPSGTNARKSLKN